MISKTLWIVAISVLGVLILAYGTLFTVGYVNRAPPTGFGKTPTKFIHPKGYQKETWGTTNSLPKPKCGQFPLKRKLDPSGSGNTIVVGKWPFVDFMHKKLGFYERVLGMTIKAISFDKSVPWQKVPYATQGFKRLLAKNTDVPYGHWKMYMRVENETTKTYAMLCFQRRNSRLCFEECKPKWNLGNFIEVSKICQLTIGQFADCFRHITHFSEGVWWIPSFLSSGEGPIYACHDLIWDATRYLGIPPVPSMPETVHIRGGPALTSVLRGAFEKERFESSPAEKCLSTKGNKGEPNVTYRTSVFAHLLHP